MIDTHSHIDAEVFNPDRPEVLERAWEAGLEAIVIPSIEPSGFDELQRLVDSDPRLYRGIGIHPHSVANLTMEHIERVERESVQQRVVAIGEIGLDYYYDFAPREQQKLFFREQLRVAKRRKLPVIVHNRESDDDILRILQEEQDGSLRGVLHCFSSDESVLQRALDVGFHVSFTGNVTFKKSTLDSVVAAVPADRFMIETDAPYITPVPHRGKRNEPSFVRFVAEKIALIRNCSTEEIVSMTTENARRFFTLMLFVLLVALQPLHAQSNEEEPDHPYLKKLGFGPVLTTNTIVEAQTDSGATDARSFSYEGVFSYGGAINYEFSDRFMVEAAYIYTKNKKVLRNPTSNANGQQYANVHQTAELGVKYLWNPYSRVVFYLTGGVCTFFNAYDGGDGVKDDSLSLGRVNPVYGYNTTVIGLCGGLGLFANIKTSIGLFAPGGEWRVDFFLKSEDRLLFPKATGAPVKSNISTFFSLPRFTLLWFPKL